MTLKIIIILICAVLGIGLLTFLNHTGFFAKVLIEEKTAGPYILVFDEHIGDYRNTAAVQDKIYYSLLNDYKIETYKGFGIYYDDPKKVPKDKLRSKAGCILEQTDYDKIEMLKEKGFKILEMAEAKSVVVEFPFKNPLSILAGIKKVYPRIDKYLQINKYSKNEMLEIYNIPEKKIIYIMNIHQ